MYVVDTTVTIAAGTDNYAMTCAYCLPGYTWTAAATGLGSKNRGTCTLIANCSTNSTWVNSCSKCLDGFAWKVVSGVIKENICTKTGPNNDISVVKDCVATDGTDCVLCKRGLSLNADK